MLQFANSSVFQSQTSTQGKIFCRKQNPSKNLSKSLSYTNLLKDPQEKLQRPTFHLENIQKRSIKQKTFKRSGKDEKYQKKPFQIIENTRVLMGKKSQSTEKSQILFNPVMKQNCESQMPITMTQTPSKKNCQQTTIFIKKRPQLRSITTQISKQKGVGLKKSASFIRRDLNTTMKKFTQITQQPSSNRRKLQKEELYYVDDLKRQMSKVNIFDQDQDQSVPMIVGHFFQSISTFYRYKELRHPDEPKLSVFLPKQRKFKTTLIFDMDQTLIHAEPFQKDFHLNSWGQNMEITIDDGTKVMINLKIRPFALEVLHRLKSRFQIGVFTAANQTYARQILAKIDPTGKIFDFQLFRQHCDVVEGKLAIKDLRILSNRSIKNIILVDNSPHTYLYQKENAIPIISFYNDLRDQEMVKLEDFLKSEGMEKRDDIRTVLENRFKFRQYVKHDSLQDLIYKLYG